MPLPRSVSISTADSPCPLPLPMASRAISSETITAHSMIATTPAIGASGAASSPRAKASAAKNVTEETEP